MPIRKQGSAHSGSQEQGGSSQGGGVSLPLYLTKSLPMDDASFVCCWVAYFVSNTNEIGISGFNSCGFTRFLVKV